MKRNVLFFVRSATFPHCDAEIDTRDIDAGLLMIGKTVIRALTGRPHAIFLPALEGSLIGYSRLRARRVMT